MLCCRLCFQSISNMCFGVVYLQSLHSLHDTGIYLSCVFLLYIANLASLHLSLLTMLWLVSRHTIFLLLLLLLFLPSPLSSSSCLLRRLSAVFNFCLITLRPPCLAHSLEEGRSSPLHTLILQDTRFGR